LPMTTPAYIKKGVATSSLVTKLQKKTLKNEETHLPYGEEGGGKGTKERNSESKISKLITEFTKKQTIGPSV